MISTRQQQGESLTVVWQCWRNRIVLVEHESQRWRSVEALVMSSVSLTRDLQASTHSNPHTDYIVRKSELRPTNWHPVIFIHPPRVKELPPSALATPLPEKGEPHHHQRLKLTSPCTASVRKILWFKFSWLICTILTNVTWSTIGCSSWLHHQQSTAVTIYAG